MKILFFLGINLLFFNAKAIEKKAILAGGCFWCIEESLENLKGVTGVVSGYIGQGERPTYKKVSSGESGFVEGVEITFETDITNYKDILNKFFKSINPTDKWGQFADRGSQYISVIYSLNERQKKLADLGIAILEEHKIFSKPIVTKVLPFTKFYKAEDYHQDYYKKNKEKYNRYKSGSGRKTFIDQKWKDRSDFNLFDLKLKSGNRKLPLFLKLTDLEFKILRKEGTETSFKNAYWNNKTAGLYVDKISGEPLFLSLDKFKSGTGWPSYTKSINKLEVVLEKDFNWGMVRTEVRSKTSNSHLGHVFDDGPKPSGKRYCINSAALDFISKSELKKKGYGEFLTLFTK